MQGNADQVENHILKSEEMLAVVRTTRCTTVYIMHGKPSGTLFTVAKLQCVCCKDAAESLFLDLSLQKDLPDCISLIH